MKDVIIVGAGVVGLATAYELTKKGLSVLVIDRGSFGKEASWAGAGMLPPGDLVSHGAEWDELFQHANGLWSCLAEELFELTGIDSGYRACGEVQFALEQTASEKERIESEIVRWEEQGAVVNRLDSQQLYELEPAVSSQVSMAYELPGSCQVRNPWLLRALKGACIRMGVQSISGKEIDRVEYGDNKIIAVHSEDESWSAKHFVFTTGAWTSHLLAERGLSDRISPVLGQIVLLSTGEPILRRIVQMGKRYLVPREDGKLLIGSTEENAGFHKRNTVRGVAGLMQFATELIPELKDAEFEKAWSGLRPKSERGLPFFGTVA